MTDNQFNNDFYQYFYHYLKRLELNFIFMDTDISFDELCSPYFENLVSLFLFDKNIQLKCIMQEANTLFYDENFEYMAEITLIPNDMDTILTHCACIEHNLLPNSPAYLYVLFNLIQCVLNDRNLKITQGVINLRTQWDSFYSYTVDLPTENTQFNN